MRKKTRNRVEFGDFQTPEELARMAVKAVAAHGVSPLSIVEPTCGTGNFLCAALDHFRSSKEVVGLEINPDYFEVTQAKLSYLKPHQNVDLRRADFFSFNWSRVFAHLPDPILVIGNPPWVTASELGMLHSDNLPVKSNFQKHKGFDALTGKSNFDIAEWMVIHLIDLLSERQAVVAMLLKTTVARKVLIHAWKAGLPLANAGMYNIDTRKYFDAEVGACLLVCELRPGRKAKKCEVFNLAESSRIDHTIAFHENMVLSNLEAFEQNRILLQDPNSEPFYRWRSGVKHDCSKVMELRKNNLGLTNGLNEVVNLEPDYIYPMLKGSGVANGGTTLGNRYMIVPQKEIGEQTDEIKKNAPKTWAYLCRYGEILDRRASTIYRNRPRFSVFGVGSYTFKPWKVAICGLYKRLKFTVIGPYEGCPVVLDDTAYHISCETGEEAFLVADLLNSENAREFLESFIFWDAKRPITVEVLSRLNILALAIEAGRIGELINLRPAGKTQERLAELSQATLF